MSEHDQLKCSFCGKEQSQVAQLVRGPNNVAVCNECAQVVLDTVEDEG